MGFLDTYDNLTQLHEAKYTVYNGRTYKDYFYPPQARKAFWQDVKHNPPRVFTDIFHIGYDEDIPDELKDSLFNEYGELESPSTWGQISKLDDTQWWVRALKKFWWIQFKAPDKEIISQARLKAERDAEIAKANEEHRQHEADLAAALSVVQKQVPEKIFNNLFNKLTVLYDKVSKLYGLPSECPYTIPSISGVRANGYDNNYSGVRIAYTKYRDSDIYIWSTEYDNLDDAIKKAVKKINQTYKEQVIKYTQMLDKAEKGRSEYTEYNWYDDFYTWALKQPKATGTFWFQDHENQIYSAPYVGSAKQFMTAVQQQDVPISAKLVAFTQSIYREPPNKRDEYRATYDRQYDKYVSVSKEAIPALFPKLRIDTDGQPQNDRIMSDTSMAQKYTKSEAERLQKYFYIDGMDMWVSYVFTKYGNG